MLIPRKLSYCYGWGLIVFNAKKSLNFYIALQKLARSYWHLIAIE